jgi:hypothetical protein
MRGAGDKFLMNGRKRGMNGFLPLKCERKINHRDTESTEIFNIFSVLSVSLW